MKILMIAPQPFFEPRGTPLSVLGRLRALSQLGHEVDLLTYPLGEDVDLPGLRVFRTPRLGVRRVPVGPSLIKVFLDVFLLFQAMGFLIKNRYDLIHTHEEACVFGSALARLFRVLHLYDMHSSMPQALKNYGYPGLRPLIKLFEWLERCVIRSSVAVVTISPSLAEHVARIDASVLRVVIEDAVERLDLESISPLAVDALRKELALSSRCQVVLYAGTFEPYQGLELLLDCAQEVVARENHVVFLLVGGQPAQVRRYQDRVEELGLQAHFRLPGSRPPHEIPALMKLAHVLVSPRLRGDNPPLKLYAYLQSEKPIVATRHLSHTQVLSDDIAVLVDADPSALAQGILAVFEDPSYGQALGKAARRFFAQQYDGKNALGILEQLLRTIESKLAATPKA